MVDVQGMEIASTDTRRRALAAYAQSGRTQPEIAAIFGVSLRTFQRWWRAWQTEGRDAPGHSPGRPRIIVGEVEERLRKEVAKKPDATLHELAEKLGHIAGTSTIHRTLAQWDLPLKKRLCEPQSRTETT